MSDLEFRLPSPADEERSWSWESMHTPAALSPLAGDYFTTVLSAIDRRFREAGVPMRMESRMVNGYAYFCVYSTDPAIDPSNLPEPLQQMRRALARTLRRDWDERIFPALMRHYQWFESFPIADAGRDDLVGGWEKAWELVSEIYLMHFHVTGGSYTILEELADFYESVVEGASPGEALKLVRGGEGELQRVDKDLYELGIKAAATPGVRDAILQKAAPETFESIEGGKVFLAALEDFLTKHGHLGQAFDDLEQRSWSDDPRMVLAEVRKRIDQPPRDPEERRLALLREARAMEASVRQGLEGNHEELGRFDEILAVARDVGGLSEDHNYWIDRMMHKHMNRFARGIGLRLTEADVIADPEDVFFLHRDEVDELLRDGGEVRALVSERRSHLARWRTAVPPAYLGKPVQEGVPGSRFWGEANLSPEDDPSVLKGNGACGGVGRGAARLVSVPEDFLKVEPGDVLVCRSSNPSYVPLFAVISGLVTDTGGVLSHAAVVAREFGVPAVVGTGDATSRIRDGQTVEIDGDRGEVRLL